MSDKLSDNWYTIAEAVGIFGVSDRTIRRRIGKGEIKTKLEGRTRYVFIDNASSTLPDDVSSIALIEQLRGENDHLRQQVNDLQAQLKEERTRADEARERQDTLMLQLTRQLEQSQRLLDYHQAPWWRRWFGKKRSNVGSEL